MAAPASLDPLALVRDAVNRLEKFVNERAVPLMKSEGFASGANKLVSAALIGRKLARDLTQRWFEALNVPSRSDVIALGDRLQALEDRLIGIQSALDDLAGRDLPAARVASRTRRPPAAEAPGASANGAPAPLPVASPATRPSAEAPGEAPAKPPAKRAARASATPPAERLAKPAPRRTRRPEA